MTKKSVILLDDTLRKDLEEHKVKVLQDRIVELENQILILQTKINILESQQKLVIPNEQVICELEIKKLQDESLKRSLTFEETKKLDLLVKNLYLAKGQSTAIINAEYHNLTDAKLLEIASSGKDDGGTDN